jgi:hypothetical protein
VRGWPGFWRGIGRAGFEGDIDLSVECKRIDAPRLTSSMRIALDDLALDHLTVIYPGDRPYPLAGRVSVVPLTASATTGAQALDPSSPHLR